jgi:hypothetical protein
MCDPESYVAQEREEARRPWASVRDHLEAAKAELGDRPSRHELRREAAELEEDLRARRERRR